MGATCTQPTPTGDNTGESNMMARNKLTANNQSEIKPEKVVHHSNMFIEMSLYTKITGLILRSEDNQRPLTESDLSFGDDEVEEKKKDPPVFHYSLSFSVRYNGREMTWEEHPNHSKPLHKAQNFRLEYALGKPDQTVSYLWHSYPFLG